MLLLTAGEEARVAEKFMTQAINLRFKNAEHMPFGYQYLVALDATFILEVLKKLPSSVRLTLFFVKGNQNYCVINSFAFFRQNLSRLK